MSRAQLTSTDQQNSGGPVSPFVAGKNKIINGDFLIWQRGTSITVPTATTTYTTDRFYVYSDHSSGTASVSRQTFTPGTAPVAGYEGSYFARWTQGTGATYWELAEKIEDVRTFAGQTVTFSFWAKASANASINLLISQIFGSGGSSPTTVSSSASITTSWARYSAVLNVPSISGKTIGTNSNLQVYINQSTPVNTLQIDTWGWQVEAGSVATPFTTASGTLQGELALCQRYYLVFTNTTQTALGTATYYSSSQATGYFQFPVTMRVAPTGVVASGTNYYAIERNSGTNYLNSITTRYTSTNATAWINSTEASGTAGQAGGIKIDNASGSIAMNAEL